MAKKLYGTDPDQVPTNADLGTMAYQDSANVVIDGGSARINAARPASVDTARAELELYASGDAPTYIINNSDRGAAGQHIAEFRGQWDGTAVARMVVAAGTDTTNKDDGVLSFWTASAGTLAKAAEFTSGGNLAFPNGQGIDFSASEGGGASSSILDDYEEGTWTPTYSFGISGSATASSVTQGYYVKVGKMVQISFQIATGSISSPTGDVIILNLPFTASSQADNRGGLALGFFMRFGTDMPNLTLGIIDNTSFIRLHKNATTASTSTLVQGSDFSGGANQNYLYASGTYQTA